MKHNFGGDWTEAKLNRVKQYLDAYSVIMNKQTFRFAYIDAFAGTGYRDVTKTEDEDQLFFPGIGEPTNQLVFDGSARIALQVQPRFTSYIFIENRRKNVAELEKLRGEFPELSKDIAIVNQDANVYLQDLCLNYKWNKNRAVLFLDPYGLQVTWTTLKAIASTKAIDLWILFPLGVGVNRLLRKDGKINENEKNKLSALFGNDDWFLEFYKPSATSNLFEDQEKLVKSANFDSITKYYLSRLRELFPGVAKNPLRLVNSKNNPLYLLCFASANPKGSKIAINIAQYILKK